MSYGHFKCQLIRKGVDSLRNLKVFSSVDPMCVKRRLSTENGKTLQHFLGCGVQLPNQKGLVLQEGPTHWETSPSQDMTFLPEPPGETPAALLVPLTLSGWSPSDANGQDSSALRPPADHGKDF